MATQWRETPTRPDTVSVTDRAHENLAFIRSTMANSTSFTGVPGVGMVAMGVIALVGGFVATRADDPERWLWCWTAVAFSGCSVGVAAMVLKARLRKVPLWHGSGKRFLLNFSPAILAGAILGEAFYRTQPNYGLVVDSFMPSMWLLLYGAAVISGGAFSVRPVSIMGVCFMAAGLLTLLLPTNVLALSGTVRPYDVVLAATFGGFHIVFGGLIALKHGG